MPRKSKVDWEASSIDEFVDSLPPSIRNKLLGKDKEPDSKVVARKTAFTCGMCIAFLFLVILFISAVTFVLIAMTP